jgi:pilus assembly protein CpaC
MRRIAWLFGLLTLIGSAVAQQLPEEVSLAVGESRVLNVEVRRAALGTGKVVSLAMPERGQLLLFGEAAGHTTAQLWLADGSLHLLRINVSAEALEDDLKQVQGLLGTTSGVGARIVGSRILLEGERVSAADRQLAEQIAALFPGRVLDLLGPDNWEAMVQMDVRLVEIRRDQLRQLGLRWPTQVAGPNVSAVAGGDAGALTVHAVLSTSLQSQIDLLQQKGMAFVVAEPTLSCRSGGVARFISGGEVPIPVTDGLGATDVQYKEYGVILEVRPRTDRSGAIYADVDVELSQLDASVRAGDFPGFVKRRTSTAVNMQSGETVAISGLVARELSRDRQGLPVLSALPLAGGLFASSRRQQRQTELLVLITPHRFDAAGAAGAVSTRDQSDLVDRAQALKAAGGAP